MAKIVDFKNRVRVLGNGPNTPPPPVNISENTPGGALSLVRHTDTVS